VATELQSSKVIFKLSNGLLTRWVRKYSCWSIRL